MTHPWAYYEESNTEQKRIIRCSCDCAGRMKRMKKKRKQMKFVRISFAALHCVDVKGHSKSVGYEPGMHIAEGKFTNTWNAVLIDDEWRFVQCNWGAR